MGKQVNPGCGQDQVPDPNSQEFDHLHIQPAVSPRKYPVPAQKELGRRPTDIAGQITRKVPAVEPFDQDDRDQKIRDRTDDGCSLGF